MTAGFRNIVLLDPSYMILHSKAIFIEKCLRLFTSICGSQVSDHCIFMGASYFVFQSMNLKINTVSENKK